MKSLDRAVQKQKQRTEKRHKATQKIRGVPNETRYKQSGKTLRGEGRVVC